jgi:hypothetical protein
MERELENEREWRRYLTKQIDEIQQNQNMMLVTMTTLKIKIGAISSVFGAIGAIVVSFVSKKF